jgi:hypothetical protein
MPLEGWTRPKTVVGAAARLTAKNMRLFQVSGFYGRYLDDFYGRNPDHRGLSYAELRDRLLMDRFDGSHLLEPVQQHDPSARWAVRNDAVSQLKWARENGLKSQDLDEILLSQIEEHRAEVLYASDISFWGRDFARRLPGGVKRRVCWHAAPLGNEDLSAFDLLLTSHPPYIGLWRNNGLNAAEFYPSHDPAMEPYASRDNRPIDVCFVGTYSGLHHRRNELVRAMASLSDRYSVVLALLHPRFRPLLNIRGLRRIPSFIPYLPKELRKLAVPPVFGLRLYELLSRSKIALNGAWGGAGRYKRNMRCWEAMGCGACMLSDEGEYPEGMVAGEHFIAYTSAEDAAGKAERLLAEPEGARAIGRKAALMVASLYSKHQQWTRFQELVGSL